MKAFTFGMKTMRVTQNYNSTYSHKPHWYGSKDYADYPIDLGGEDGNRSPYYATVDMKVTAIKGKGNSTTNTIWLVATEQCNTPSGKMTPFIMLTHWNDNDPYVNKLKVGSIVKAGQAICEEGIDGATANHLHMVCGNADKGVGNGLIKNSNGKWVSNGYCMKPEQVMFVDKEFTNVVDTNSIKFEDKPEDSFLPDRGYFKKGDSGEEINLIDDFFASQVKGNYFGDYTEACVKVFQKQNGLEQDGCIGAITLAKMEEKGFKR